MPFPLHQTIHQELDLASNISAVKSMQHLMPDRIRYHKISAANREMYHYTKERWFLNIKIAR
jgi:hypothetical protein